MKYLRYLAYLSMAIAFSCARADAYVDFFRAVAFDNAGKVTELLGLGFDPNTLSEHGQVPLYVALQEDCPAVVKVLLASPALKVDANNIKGETPLMMAALKGQLDMARMLIERGAKVRKSGWTPAHYAASGPSAELLAMLLERGADIDARSPDGSTPLMMAARFGAEDSIELLVRRGADKSLRNERGQSPADLARNADRMWALRWLD